MGLCCSLGAPVQLLDHTDGDDTAFHQRFLEDKMLGEGEFGIVKMVHDTQQQEQPNAVSSVLACKTLRKGMFIRHNVVYSPLKPEVLKGEVRILRTLAGQSFCLRLVAVYETPKAILMVTEFCAGGEMMEWVAALTEDLRTEQVSRVAYQLLSAVHHCTSRYVIHRDIKPENVMFQNKDSTSELRLIDFGSGVLDTKAVNGDDPNPEDLHSTFAGSAFYISPEMFQRTYTYKTDVWSVGASLYVLVAGYPANQLQRAFNILQMSQNRSLRKLPNIPDNLPDSFYKLLDACLTFRHKRRPSAGTLLDYEFVQFHHNIAPKGPELGMSLKDVAAEAAGAKIVYPTMKGTSTASVSLRGSVHRHAAFLGFKKFERSLTTLLATMLTRTELEQLLTNLRDHMGQIIKNNAAFEQAMDPAVAAAIVAAMDPTMEDQDDPNDQRPPVPETKLAVIPVGELKRILKDELNHEKILETMAKIPNSSIYDSFAYHVALLMEFSLTVSFDHNNNIGSSGRKKVARHRSLRRSLANKTGNSNVLINSNGSLSSLRSLRSSGNNSSSRGRIQSNSLRGGRAFAPPVPLKPKRSQSLAI